MKNRLPLPSTLALLLTLLASPARATWPVDGLGVGTANCAQLLTAVVADGQGGVFVAWDDQRACQSYSLCYLQHVRGNGSLAPGWPVQGIQVCTTFSGQSGAVLVADGGSGVFAAWNDTRRGPTAVAVEHIASDGTRQWDPAGVTVCDSTGNQARPGILPDGAGGLYVGWVDHRRGRDDGPPHHHWINDLFVQHLDASGNMTWGPGGVAAVTTSFIAPAPVLAPARGGVLVAWQDRLGPVRMQRFDASGALLLGADGATITGPFAAPFVPDARGGIVGAFAVGPGGTTDAYAQRVDSTGAIQWGPNADLISNAFADQYPTSVAADGTGGEFVTWYDLRNGSDWDIYAQHLDGTGAVKWSAGGVPVCTAANYQIAPQVVADGSGGCVIAWSDVRDSSSGFDIYAQRLDATGAISTSWPANGVALCRAPGDQMQPLLVSDGHGGALVVWNDSRGDGDVYAHFVSAFGTLDDSTGSGGVGPEPPPSFTLALAFPNPGTGEALSFRLSLPDGAPAVLSLLDAGGRVLASTHASVAGGGRATVTLEPASRLAPGVYLVRLEQAGRTASHKVAVYR